MTIAFSGVMVFLFLESGSQTRPLAIYLIENSTAQSAPSSGQKTASDIAHFVVTLAAVIASQEPVLPTLASARAINAIILLRSTAMRLASTRIKL
ncbi:hypothetical protein ACLB1Q_11045 [Escherichia coli]